MNRRFWILFIVILFGATALRTVQLSQRPMHTDEAVHASKFGELLERHSYRYDPFEYHGPTLNFFTLIPAWCSGAHSLQQVSERTLRLVPAFFGLALLFVFLLLKKQLATPALLLAALFTAVSPAMVFFSRYYIQEMLLVCFSFAALVCSWRFVSEGKRAWAILTGLFIGLMHASKETFIIPLAAALIAGVIVWRFKKLSWHVKKNDVLWMGAAAVLVSVFFFSSFGQNPKGVLDSVLTYKTYLARAAGSHQSHLHPWYYYLQLLAFNHMPSRPVWGEGFILFWFLVGLVWVYYHHRTMPSFLLLCLIYSGLVFLIYSALSYKTPWTMLGFYQPLIFCTAVMCHALFNQARKWSRRLLVFLLSLGAVYFLAQAVLLNFRYCADPSNPYVYGHTSNDIFKIVERIRQISRVHDMRDGMYVEVICSGDDYWPLPWYLRSMSRVGYWNHVEMQLPVPELIIASSDLEEQVLQKVYELPPPGERNMYVPLFDDYTELRPGVEIRGYVTKELWDRFWQNTETNLVK
jgi:uncharacterized protein (TIGR03663 family)